MQYQFFNVPVLIKKYNSELRVTSDPDHEPFFIIQKKIVIRRSKKKRTPKEMKARC